MPLRTVLPLSAPDPPSPQTDITTTPAEHQESPVDTGLDDDDDYLELLPQEKHIQLALTASQAGLLSQRKAALYYRVLHSTVQGCVKGCLTLYCYPNAERAQKDEETWPIERFPRLAGFLQSTGSSIVFAF
ncbi:hypothetical protein DFH07DRAFT_763626 [Mycena maculata]|uniref:Uncharacterized protein n=1 Tax=Mycena maculata TaxID=230809 RepID=A0AAD7KHR8_9AGAR|nr:hypothetical protein DFH07DRAFT_763626 [Mycena maculata]